MKRRISQLISCMCLLLNACGAVTPVSPTATRPANTNTPIPSATSTATATFLPPEELDRAFATAMTGSCPIVPINLKDPVADADLLAEFAGRYSSSYEGHSQVVMFNCDLTFHIYVSESDVTVHSLEGQFLIQQSHFAINHVTEVFPGKVFPTWYLPVRWGARKYLVLPGAIENFCNRLGQLGDPGNGMAGEYYLKTGDEALQGSGEPIDPSGEKICP